jgi:ABC-type sugar transport system ATPase subunit
LIFLDFTGEVFRVNQPVLSARNICKSFGSNNVLDDVSIDFYSGEVHALIGVNGAGKSTLVKILQGVYQCDKGAIVLNGENVRFTGPPDAMRNGIAMVFQELNIFPEMTVTENVLMGGMIKRHGKIDWNLCHSKVQEFFDSLNIGIDVHDKAGSLPLAQRQLVEIVKNVYKSPKVIFLDEPSSALSKNEEAILYRLVLDLKRQGITVALITHKMEEIFSLCDSLTILRDGKCISSGPVSSYTLGQVTEHMLGEEIDIFKRSGSTKGDRGKVVFSVQNLYLGRKLRGISFELYKGEVLAITGLVGSGKSDLARTIFGVSKGWKGDIFMNEQNIRITNPTSASNANIGYLPISRKDEGIIETLTVKKNITLALLDKLGFVVKHEKEDEICSAMMELFNVLPRDADLPITSLSGGNQQKVIISRWIASGKQLLLLDEPTRGVDVGAKREIYDKLRGLADDGVGIIVFSSETDELLGVSDRILIMSQGEVITELVTALTSREEILRYSMAGSQ